MRLARQASAGALALVVISVVFAVAPNAEAATSGTLVITSSRTLTEDHNGNVRIARDGVTLNCAEHTIAGTATAPTGIDLSDREQVIVRNCRIRGFVNGIRLADAANNSVLSNNVSGAASDACVLNGAVFNFVGDNTFNANGGGCGVVDSTENTFDGNTIWNNTD
jgi:parallel beta-helix repeat protein